MTQKCIFTGASVLTLWIGAPAIAQSTSSVDPIAHQITSTVNQICCISSDIDQDGGKNSTITEQTGEALIVVGQADDDNEATITQTHDSDQADLRDFDPQANVLQRGDATLAKIDQTYDGDARNLTALADHYGGADIDQIAHVPDFHGGLAVTLLRAGASTATTEPNANSFRAGPSTAAVRQSGSISTIIQSGDCNDSFVRQGSGSNLVTTSVTQSGNENEADVLQQSGGRLSSAVVGQAGTNATAFVEQIGQSWSDEANISQLDTSIDATARITQNGDANGSPVAKPSDNLGTISQEGGTLNFSEITQTGFFNTAESLQNGSNLNSEITQIGNNNFADVNQFGDGHVSVVIQSGTGNIASVTQN